MSWQAAADPDCSMPISCDPVDAVIVPRARDLGGFEVRRALPAARRQMVGPFIFFDQMGPAEFGPGTGMDVRPHPHIGLSTLTWLIEGEILHRDSLGSLQPIRPGEVNWMTAGRGIAHSERTPPQQRRTGARLFGLQTWLALPRRHEETEPRFEHYGADELPVIDDDDMRVVLIAGSGWGRHSPVSVFSETIYADASLPAGARLPIPAEHEERAIYLLAGRVRIAGETFEPGSLLVLKPRHDVTVTAQIASRLLVLGGEPMDGPRFIWWNFVSSSKERIRQAREDWQAQRFAKVPGDDEFIPLPER
ncbi:MAG: pirin family protein [Pseudomonadota bacterium]